MKSLLLDSMKVISVFFGSLFFAASLHALTVDEIIRLKEAGVEDRTIQLLMQQEKANREASGGVGTGEINRPDGGKDRIYYSVSTPEEELKVEQEEREKMDRALEILRNIEIYDRRR